MRLKRLFQPYAIILCALTLLLASIGYAFSPAGHPVQIEASAQQVSLYRGDAQRTGSYNAPAVRQFNRVKWQKSVGQINHGGVIFADGVIYTLSNDRRLLALDASTGNAIWSFKPKPDSPLFSPVAVADGVVYVLQDKRMYALEAQTGKPIWKFKTKGLGLSAPLIVGSTIYFGNFDDNFYAVDINARKLKWKIQVGDSDARPVFSNGKVYFDSADFSKDQSFLYAVDAETGQVKWRLVRPTAEAWRSSASADGMLYIGQGKGFFALDGETGEAIWSYQGGGSNWSAPAAADGIVYVGNEDGFVQALNGKTGELIWRFKAEDSALADPIVSDGVVYFGVGSFTGMEGPRNFYALDGKTGQMLWSFRADNKIVVPAAIGNGAVYFASVIENSGTLYAVE